MLEHNLQDAKEEMMTKDSHIRRLDEEISLLQKENDHLLQKLQEIEFKSSQEIQKRTSNFMKLNSFNQNYIELNEEKNKLQNEITELQSKLRQYESEIKTKYILKSEHNNAILLLEKENKNLNAKIKSFETSAEKLKHEYHSLRTQNDGLKLSISNYEKRIVDINNNALNPNFNNDLHNDSNATPLNLLFENEEENHEIEKKKFMTGRLLGNSINPSPRDRQSINMTLNDMKNSKESQSLNLMIRDYNIKEKAVDKRVSNHNVKKLSSRRSVGSFKQNLTSTPLNELKDDSEFLDDISYGRLENKISVTPKNIIMQMEKNELYETVREVKKKEERDIEEHNENGIKKVAPIQRLLTRNKVEVPRLNLKKENLFNYEQYKDFFFLTFQAFKLNSDDIEPFLYVFTT